MRVLAVETSSPRGSVALLEGGRLLAEKSHEQPNSHAEQILPLIRELLAEAGFAPSSLDRIGTGIGPGSFTGLRVGIALAVGIGLGLDRPVVGVGSLRAMARGVPPELPGLRCPLLDARREELFVAIYDSECRELAGAQDLGRAGLSAALSEPGGRFALDRLPGRASGVVLVGSVLDQVEASGPGLVHHRTPETDLPHAHWVGVLASELDPALNPPEPIYVRGAGATLPNLPPSPLPD